MVMGWLWPFSGAKAKNLAATCPSQGQRSGSEAQGEADSRAGPQHERRQIAPAVAFLVDRNATTLTSTEDQVAGQKIRDLPVVSAPQYQRTPDPTTKSIFTSNDGMKSSPSPSIRSDAEPYNSTPDPRRVQIWSEFVDMQRVLIDDRVAALDARKAYKEKRHKLRSQLASISGMIDRLPVANIQSEFRSILDDFSTISHAIGDLDEVEQVLDEIEDRLAQREYKLERTAPILFDQPSETLQALHEHGYDFQGEASQYSTEHAVTDTDVDLDPEAEMYESKLSDVNSLEDRLVQIHRVRSEARGRDQHGLRASISDERLLRDYDALPSDDREETALREQLLAAVHELEATRPPPLSLAPAAISSLARSNPLFVWTDSESKVLMPVPKMEHFEDLPGQRGIQELNRGTDEAHEKDKYIHSWLFGTEANSRVLRNESKEYPAKSARSEPFQELSKRIEGEGTLGSPSKEPG